MSNVIAIKLKPSAERLIKKGHPWVFSDSIIKINSQGKAGDIAVLFDSKTNKPFAVGLFDPKSPIQIKIIHHNSGAKINQDFFESKIETSFKLRLPLLESKTNAYRLIFGENDGFPGMILDVYNTVGVIKLYSEIWFPYLQMLIPKIVELTKVEALILRLSRNLQNEANPYKEGDILFGKLENEEVIFEEHGVQFKTNVLLGHKTGFFLDHRANRHRIGQLSKGKSVIDVFSYAGGFSVHALKGGATSVTSVDFSKQALELALQNSKLNATEGKHLTISGDAFEILNQLKEEGQVYDVVVIDPPSFAKSQKERNIAKKKYAELTELGVSLTRKGGILFLASCSSRITMDEFRQIHIEEFKRLGISYELLEVTQHDIDHPISFEEGAYLKSFYYRIF